MIVEWLLQAFHGQDLFLIVCTIHRWEEVPIGCVCFILQAARNLGQAGCIYWLYKSMVMKNSSIHSNPAWAILFAFLPLGSCQDKLLETYEVNNPIYMSYEDLRSAVSDTTPAAISRPGKIYLYGDLILVNEVRKGVHVINNTDPANPEVISFIKVPGNIDMAIKNNILYADSYVDLVAIDISDLHNIREVARFEDLFSWSLPPYEAGTRVGLVDDAKGVVVDWKVETVTEELDWEDQQLVYPTRMWESAMRMDMVSFATANGTGDGSMTGTGGSMARFIIYHDMLYVIDQSNLHMFDINHELAPVSAGSKQIGWNIETVFIAREHLFIGSTTGMYIYSLIDPANPEFVSTYWHVTSCDPVVVEGNYAYITLRTGNICETDVNQLEIVDIHKLASPIKIKSYPMNNPHGLGIDQGILFICDGDAGLKVYDASDPLNLNANQLAHFTEINTFDVIPVQKHLIMIGEDGLYQYDYVDVQDINLLSMIPIVAD